MEARVAERADFGPWLELAAEVETLFGPMARDPVFQRALLRSIARGTAFCIRENDGCPGSHLVAGLLLSPRPPVHRIGWLVVTESERRSGLGRALLDRALAGIEPPAEVLVITFGPDAPGGESARSLLPEDGVHPGGDVGAGSQRSNSAGLPEVARKGCSAGCQPRTSATT